jgi:peptidoglycan hydrolase-like protein with peptidoglycan-binding domain/3D (Asp-Asp-Asp) domain-containing protein
MKSTKIRELAKYTSAICLVISVLLPSAVRAEVVNEAAGERRIFKVTAYYSPLPNQSRYVKGSYEADIRLNGRGTNAADGTEVYPGMLAAPYTYPFGTKIYLPGLGLGTVHDRGGAIVPAGLRGQAYDRIDVWMGRGEEGLARAMNWGARVVEGIVYFGSADLQSNFSYANVPLASISHLPGAAVARTQALNLLGVQRGLAQLGFYNGPINGKQNESLTAAIERFQLEKGIIASKKDAGAGVFGPKTTSSFYKINGEIEQEKHERITHIKAQLPRDVSVGNTDSGLPLLRKTLNSLGYNVESVNSAQFDQNLEETILKFQIDNRVITNAESNGAGVFGPKTRATMLAVLANRNQQLENPLRASSLLSQTIEGVDSPTDTPSVVEQPTGAPNNTKPVLVRSFPATQNVNTGVASVQTTQSKAVSATFGADL